MKKKITSKQVAALKQYAATHERLRNWKSIAFRVGERHNLDDPDRGINHNILLITDHPDWDDTDLYDNSWSIADVNKMGGFDLTEDGRLLIDLYFYAKKDDDLLGNVQGEFKLHDNGAFVLVKMTGTMFPDEHCFVY